MSILRILPVVGLLLVGFSHFAVAAQPLVTPDWILSNIGKPGLVFLDVRHSRAFARKTVPGAVNTSYGRDWLVKRQGVPGMMPSKDQLEKLIGGLGITNTDHVVILPGGYSASEMGMATRIYWTLKVAGHGKVSILDGGLQKYFALGNKAIVGAGNNKPKPAPYTVVIQNDLLATDKDVRVALSSGQSLIDNRPPGQYLGINSGGSPKRLGTLKSAINIPAQWLTVDDGGTFRSANALKALFTGVGAKTSEPIITFCNTGHWASVGWFVTHELMGNTQSRLYDGSMAEWTIDPKNPVEQKVALD